MSKHIVAPSGAQPGEQTHACGRCGKLLRPGRECACDARRTGSLTSYSCPRCGIGTSRPGPCSHHPGGGS